MSQAPNPESEDSGELDDGELSGVAGGGSGGVVILGLSDPTADPTAGTGGGTGGGVVAGGQGQRNTQI